MNKLAPRTALYRARRDALRARAGGHCARCANSVDLQFDCIKPRGAWHHLIGSLQRISFYEQEFEAGNLQLLCARHHTEKSIDDVRRRRYPWTYEI